MAETTNLKLFKHDNPSTNDAEFDIDNALNDNWDKIDEIFGNANDVIVEMQTDVESLKSENDTQNENIEKNTDDIDKLKTQKEALEKEVQNLREDNRLNSLTEDNEGELINITNSTGSRFNALEIEGNEKQDTREGYNLFDILNATIQNQDKGVTITKNEDGSITANGTPSADWIVFIRDYGIGNKLEDGQTYTLWQENYSEEDTGGIYLQIIANPNEGSSQTQKIYNASTSKKTFVVDKTNYNYQLVIQTAQIAKAGVFENYKNRYMLYKGTDDKEFELYGAMPSFDYESPIKCVGDNINLFDGEIEAGGFIGTTGVKTDMSNTIRNKNTINVKGLKKIIFSCNSMAQAINFYEYDKNNSFLKYTNLAKNKYLELNANTEYVNFSRSNTIDVSKIKVESGEKVTAYSNFKQGNLHLKVLNKNFIDISRNASITKGGMTFTTDNNGVLTINGTATTNIYLKLDNNDLLDNDIPNWKKRILRKGTYVFSVENLSGQTKDINMSAYIRNGAYAEDYALLYHFFKSEKTTKTFTLAKDVNRVIYLWIYAGITLNNAKLKFQLELAESATDIIANEQKEHIIPVQQKMFKQDKFIKINRKWKEMHNWKELNLSQVNFWKTDNSANSDSILRFTTSVNDGSVVMNGRAKPKTVLCEKLDCIYIIDAYTKECIATHTVSNQLNIFINKNRLTDETVEAFKQYLTQNEIIVYYKLAEPLYLDCTPEQIAVLDKIEQEAKTYEGVTNIYTEDEVGAVLKTNTAVDLKSVINNVVEAQLQEIGG